MSRDPKRPDARPPTAAEAAAAPDPTEPPYVRGQVDADRIRPRDAAGQAAYALALHAAKAAVIDRKRAAAAARRADRLAARAARREGPA